MGLIYAKFGDPWLFNDVNQIKKILPQPWNQVYVKCVKYMQNEMEFHNSCATCRQIVFIICLRKREITQREIKGLPESVEIPKGSQEETEEGGGEVRDRVKNIGEERRGEMGLSDF